MTCFNRINSGLFYIINNPTLSFDEFESLLVGPFVVVEMWWQWCGCSDVVTVT